MRELRAAKDLVERARIVVPVIAAFSVRVAVLIAVDDGVNVVESRAVLVVDGNAVAAAERRGRDGELYAGELALQLRAQVLRDLRDAQMAVRALVREPGILARQPPLLLLVLAGGLLGLDPLALGVAFPRLDELGQPLVRQVGKVREGDERPDADASVRLKVVVIGGHFLAVFVDHAPDVADGMILHGVRPEEAHAVAAVLVACLLGGGERAALASAVAQHDGVPLARLDVRDKLDGSVLLLHGLFSFVCAGWARVWFWSVPGGLTPRRQE